MQTCVRSAALTLGALLFIACGPPPRDRALDIKPEAPSGLFEGAAWAMATATVTYDATDQEVSVRLFGESVGTCEPFPPQGSTVGYILFTMPAKVGRRPLQLSLSDFSDPDNQTVTFVTPPSSNNISVDGLINVTEVTGTSISFGIIAEAGDDNEISGTVSSTFCD